MAVAVNPEGCVVYIACGAQTLAGGDHEKGVIHPTRLNPRHSLKSANAENWNIAGVWSGEANGYSFRMTLRQSGSTFTGLYYDQSGQGDATSSLTGSIDFERNTIRFIRTLPDGYTQTYTGFIFWGWTKGRGMAGTFGTSSSTSEAGWYAKR